LFNLKLTKFEVGLVEVGDFQLTARRRLKCVGQLANLLIIEIETRNHELALWVGRLLFY
jgi:hypothetical protein